MVPAYAVATVGGPPEAAPPVRGSARPQRRREPEPNGAPEAPAEELVSGDGADADGDAEEEIAVEQADEVDAQLVPDEPDPNGAQQSERPSPQRAERKKRSRQQRRRKHGRRR